MFRSAAFVVVCIAVATAGCVEDVKSPILFSKFVCVCHGHHEYILIEREGEYPTSLWTCVTTLYGGS